MKKWYHDRLPEIAEKPMAQNERTFADAKNERWRKLGHGYSACPLPRRGTIERVPQVKSVWDGKWFIRNPDLRLSLSRWLLQLYLNFV